MKKLSYFLLFIFMSLIVSCVSENGLSDFATIGGRVYDKYSQKPIAGVRVHSIPANNETITDAEGYYCFDNMAPGTYTIMAEKNSDESIESQTNKLTVQNKRFTGADFATGQYYVYVDALQELGHNFYMSVYEFTNGQAWGRLPLKVDEKDPSFRLRSYIINLRAGSGYTSKEFLTYFFNYCNEKSTAEGLTPCYSGSVCNLNANGYRLPTVDEWIYAAKGGKKSKGTLYCGSDNPDETAWYKENSNGTIHTVCTKMPNELGLYDLIGNVEELCYADGSNVYDLSKIRYMGGNYLYIKDDLSSTIQKNEKHSEISESGLGIRLVRTIKN